MTIPTVYRWNDTDAPVMSGTAGAMISVLKACLVTGYGDKPSAGWTLEYEDIGSTTAVFRNDHTVGKGVFLRVADAGTTSCTVQAYETMTDLDNGLGVFTPSGFSIVKSYWTGNTTLPKWCIIASEKFFHLFIYTVAHTTTEFIDMTLSTNNRGQLEHLCFGDFTPLRDEGYNSILGRGYIRYAGNVSSSAYCYGTLWVPTTSATNNIYSSRNLSGAHVMQSLIYYGTVGPAAWTGASYNTQARYTIGPPYSNDGYLHIGRPVLIETDGTSVPTTVLSERGFIPGMYFLGHNFISAVTELFGDTLSVKEFQVLNRDGKQFVMIPYGGNYGNSATISTQMFILIEVGVEW